MGPGNRCLSLILRPVLQFGRLMTEFYKDSGFWTILTRAIFSEIAIA